MKIVYCPTCKTLNDAGQHQFSLWIYYDEYALIRLKELENMQPPINTEQLKDYNEEIANIKELTATYCNHKERLFIEKEVIDSYASTNFGSFKTADDMRDFIKKYGKKWQEYIQ